MLSSTHNEKTQNEGGHFTSNNLISTSIMVSTMTQQELIAKQNEGGYFAAQQTLPQSQQ